MITVAVLLTFVVIGLPFGVLVTPVRNASLILGLSFLFGSGIAGAALFVLLALASPPPELVGTVLTTVLLLITAAGAFALRRHVRPDESDVAIQHAGLGRRRIVAVVADLVTLAIVASHALYATSVRLWEWDYLAHWGVKAKVFFLYNRVDWAFLQFRDYAFLHPDYPPLAPMLLDVLAVLRGAWEDRWAGLLYTAMGIAAILIVRGMAQAETGSRFEASLATFAVTAPALTSWIGLGEAFVAAFATAAVLLMRFAIRRNVEIRDRTFLAGATLLGFAMLSKNEGTAFFIATVIALLIAVRPPWKGLLNLWPAVVLFLPWFIIRTALHLQPFYFQEGLFPRLSRHLAQAGDLLAALVRFPPDREWMWISLIVIVLMRAGWIWRNERFLASLLAAQVGLYIVPYFLTPFGAVDQITFSWHRLCSQIAPLLVVLALLALRPWMLAIKKSAGATSPYAGFPHPPHPSTD